MKIVRINEMDKSEADRTIDINNLDRSRLCALIVMDISGGLFCNLHINLGFTSIFRYLSFHKLQTELLKYTKVDSFVKSSEIYWLTIEIILALAQPYPFLNGNNMFIKIFT